MTIIFFRIHVPIYNADTLYYLPTDLYEFVDVIKPAEIALSLTPITLDIFFIIALD